AKKKVGIKTRRVRGPGKGHDYWWCLPGQKPPAECAAAGGTAMPDDPPLRVEIAAAKARHAEAAPRPQPASPDEDAPGRKKPAREKHLQWKSWKDEGLSYARIAIRHHDETGEEVTRDAVIQALRRLPSDV